MSKFYTDVFVHNWKIHVRGYHNEDRFDEVVDFSPYLFVKSDTETPHKLLDGTYQEKMYFDNIWEAKQYERKCKAEFQNATLKYEKALRENKVRKKNGEELLDVVPPKPLINGTTDFQQLWVQETYPDQIDWDRKLISIVNIDIETEFDDTGFPVPEKAAHPITTISIRKNGKMYVFGYNYYKNERDDVYYLLCDDEMDMLNKFLKAWQILDPDIVTGWNVEEFDIPYIVNRIRNVWGEHFAKKLSPWGIIAENNYMGKYGKEVSTYKIRGITILDYMNLYRKFSFKNQEKFTLDHIAFMELGVNKIDYSEYGNLMDLYRKNYQLYVDYNIKDVELVDKIDEKMKLINIVLDVAYENKCMYEDTLGTVKPWDAYINATLASEGTVVPCVFILEDNNVQSESLEGGYVKTPINGKHECAVSVDLKSSYPHQFIMYNISYETMIDFTPNWGKPSSDKFINGLITNDIRAALVKNKMCVAGNNKFFSTKKKGFMPKIMEDMFAQRAEYIRLQGINETKYKETKDEKYKTIAESYDVKQLAKKIQINAFYGMLANKYCRWYNYDLASAITLSGQVAVKWVARAINKFLNEYLDTKDVDYIIYIDTDSNYINLKEVYLKNNGDMSDLKQMRTFLNDFHVNQLNPVIKKAFEDLTEYTNAYKNVLKMDREHIASVAIWTGKKKYVMNVIDTKGEDYTDNPKLKVTGLEAVKSVVPLICKSKMKDAYKILLNGTNDQFIDFMEEFKKEFWNLPFDKLANPGGVNGIDKYSGSILGTYKKGAPMRVKASILYNYILKTKNLEGKYRKITNGSKIKYCYLKKPNPYNADAIACLDELPAEFNMDMYVDKGKQFDKTFLAPVKLITDVLNWDHKRMYTLERFFTWDK